MGYIAKVIAEDKSQTNTLDISKEVIEIGSIRKGIEREGYALGEEVELITLVEIDTIYEYVEIFYGDTNTCVFYGYIERPASYNPREQTYTYNLVDPLQKLNEVKRWGDRKTSSFTTKNNIQFMSWSLPYNKAHKLVVKVERDANNNFAGAFLQLDEGAMVKIKRVGIVSVKVHSLSPDEYVKINPSSSEAGEYEIYFASYDGDIYIDASYYKVNSLIEDLAEPYYPNKNITLPRFDVITLEPPSQDLADFTIIWDRESWPSGTQQRNVYLLGVTTDFSTLLAVTYFGLTKRSEHSKSIDPNFVPRFAQDSGNKKMYAGFLKKDRAFPFKATGSPPNSQEHFTNLIRASDAYEFRDADLTFNLLYIDNPSFWHISDGSTWQNRMREEFSIAYMDEMHTFRYQWGTFPLAQPVIARSEFPYLEPSIKKTPISPRGLHYIDCNGDLYVGKLTLIIEPENIFEKLNYPSSIYSLGQSEFIDGLPVTFSLKYEIEKEPAHELTRSTYGSWEWVVEKWTRDGQTVIREGFPRDFPEYVWEAQKFGDIFYFRGYGDFVKKWGEENPADYVFKVSGDKILGKQYSPLPRTMFPPHAYMHPLSELFTWLPIGLAWKASSNVTELWLLNSYEDAKLREVVEMPNGIINSKMDCIAGDVENDVIVMMQRSNVDKFRRITGWQDNYIYYADYMMREGDSNLDLLLKLRIFENGYLYTDPTNRALVFTTELPAPTDWGTIEPIDENYVIEREAVYDGVRGKFRDEEYLRGKPLNVLEIDYPFDYLWVYKFRMRKLIDNLYTRLAGEKRVVNISLPLKSFYSISLLDKFTLAGIIFQIGELEFDLHNDTVGLKAREV